MGPMSSVQLIFLVRSGCLSNSYGGLSRRQQSSERIEAVSLFLDVVQVLPWGRKEAAVYGNLRANQERLGKPLADIDTLIAAHAVAVGATLVTADQAFAQVAALRAIENWATDLA